MICEKEKPLVISTVSIMYMNALCISYSHSGYLAVFTVCTYTSLLLERSESIVDSKFLWTP